MSPGSGSSGPSADIEAQRPSGSTTSAYRPLPGRWRRGSGPTSGVYSEPSRPKPMLSAYAMASLFSRWRRLFWAVAAKERSRTTPASIRKATWPMLAPMIWRALSDRGREGRHRGGVLPSTRPGYRGSAFVARDRETVAAAAHGLDRLQLAFGVELLAQAADEDFQHVGVAVEVLLVDVLGEVGLRDQLPGVHHQVLQHLVLVAGEVDVAAVHGA